MCAMMEGLLMVAIAMTIILDLVLTGVAEHGDSFSQQYLQFLGFLVEHVC